jgi:hypothetical protein
MGRLTGRRRLHNDHDLDIAVRETCWHVEAKPAIIVDL